MHKYNLNNLSDIELVAQYKHSGNNALVGELYKRYTHLIMGVCMKYLKNEEDAQDASILIFEKLLTDLKKYEIQQFKAWLHSVCKTYCLKQLRSGKVKQKHKMEMEMDFTTLMENDYELHLYKDNEKEMHLTYMEECMKGLNDEQRLCVELFFLQEKSYIEVTEVTNFTLNNVKSHIQNGKRNLKNCIEARI